MFTVEIYRGVPIYTDNTKRSHLRMKIIHAKHYKAHIFTTEADLCRYIRRFDYKSICGEYRNSFLEATMCNINDRPRYGQGNPAKYVHKTGHVSYMHSYYYGYLTKDSKGKVLDLRYNAKDIYNFDIIAYEVDKRARWIEEFEERKTKQEALWARQNPRLAKQAELMGSRYFFIYGKIWWVSLRTFRTQQERRFAAAPEHKPFIRGKRNLSNLPNSWDNESHIRLQRSWKAQTKAKRQWLANKKAHIDTIANINFKRRDFDLMVSQEMDFQEEI